MRALGTILIAATLLIGASPGWAASQRDYDDCNQLNDQDRRIAGCTRVIDDRKEPAGNRAIAYSSRGAAWNAKGDHARAISDVTRAMQLRGKASFEDYLSRANSYRLSGNPSAALDDIKAAGSAYPDKRGTPYYYHLGWNLYLLGRYDDAIEALTSAIAQQPNYYWAYFWRGLSYDKKGERAKALEDLQKTSANIDADYWDDEAKTVFAQFGLQSPSGVPINAQGLARELPSSSTSMVITAGDGDTIQVRSPSDVVKPENAWEGAGKLQAKSGYYAWKFGDGKAGRTDFVVTADNNLVGHVQIADPARQANFNWWYLAKRRP